MHLVVKNTEGELTKIEEGRAEILGVDHVVNQIFGKGLSRLIVFGETLQNGLLPGPLLYQLYDKNNNHSNISFFSSNYKQVTCEYVLVKESQQSQSHHRTNQTSECADCYTSHE